MTEDEQVSQALEGDQTVVMSSPHAAGPTRTVAIIKHHALEHRFDIEARITEAGFEIVKERQMEIDVETDPDTLVELFGEDAYSFSEGPVWVYVLERNRAVEVWQTLMGPSDPAQAKAQSPNSLRALYAVSATQNGLMGSKDGEAAEIQIASLFASSPPYPVSDLPAENGGKFNMDSVRSVASSLLSSLAADTDQASNVTDNTTNVASSEHRRTSNTFKARPVPASNAVPSIKPRMSRASALRTGIVQAEDEKTKGPRAPVTKERLAQTFANVPGHGFRTTKIQVASTAPPAVAPRMTKAAALRLGLTPEQRVRPRASTAPSQDPGDGSIPPETKGTFDGVPGHKRRESISVASTKAPTVAPRLNKAASLRGQKSEGAPPSSFGMGRSAAPSMSRSSSRQSLTGGTNNTLVRSSSVSSAARNAPPSSYTHRPTGSVATGRPPISRAASSQSLASQTGSERSPTDDVQATPKPRAARPSSINVPSVAPRQNKAAMLRAAKMAATQNPGSAVSRGKPLSTF